MNKTSKLDKENLSIEVAILLEKYLLKNQTKSASLSEANIDVSEVLGSVAFLYERFRNAVDYKREHLLRRNAIERILRRQIWERLDGDVNKISNSLVQELIWARYVENDSIPKAAIPVISNVISKYLTIFELLNSFSSKELDAKQNDVKEWFLGVASSEIEEILDSEVYYLNALNASVFSWFKKNFDWIEKNLSEEEKDTQILIAVQRGLSGFDKEQVRYHLLKIYCPDWENVTSEGVASIFKDILEYRKLIETQLDSSIQPRIFRFVQKQSAAFAVLKEIIEDDIEKSVVLFSDPRKLEKKINNICTKRYDAIRRRVNRGIVRSIIYIFASKVLLALLFEIPFEYFIVGELNYIALSINTTFPPFLMFLVGLSIKKPDESNTKRIVSKISSFVYAQEDKKRFKFTLSSDKRNNLLYKTFFVIYLGLSVLVFTGIAFVLTELNFNIVSGVIFFMFLSLVLLFGYRVRYTANELKVTGAKEGIISHLFTNLTLPLLNLGIWLSEGFSKFNFIIIIMDFLIEVPFKRIIGVFEEWTSFIRERREEVVEVPS